MTSLFELVFLLVLGDPLPDLLRLLVLLLVTPAEQVLQGVLQPDLGVLFRVCLGCLLVSLQVLQVLRGDCAVQRVFWLRSHQQPIHAVEYLSHLQVRRVVSVQHAMADPTLRVDVAMVNLGDEPQLGWLDREFLPELYVQLVQAAEIRSLIWSQ